MKALVLFRWSIAVAALAMLSGCCMSWCGARYEYRYRVFQAREEMATEQEGPLEAQILAQRFLPPGEINRAMDELTKQNFKLWKIEQVADTPYYTFILRRPVTGRMRPMLAPTEYSGVYQVQPPNEQTYFYAFQPTYYGYTVVRFHGADDPMIVDAAWDGDKLVCDQGNTHHIFILSGDGFAIAHIEEEIQPQGLNRKVFNARRVHTGKP